MHTHISFLGILINMEEYLQEIKEEAKERHIPILKDSGLSFIKNYIEEDESIRDILECGTAIGYSAIHLASIRWDMHIDTLEIDEKLANEAIENIKKCGLENQITCYICDAYEFETKKVYDLIFVDAAKSQYQKYLEHFFDNTRVGSVFIFDNLNFHGIVDDPNLSHNRSTLQMTRKIKRFRERLLNDDRFETTFYDEIGDGIAVAKRKK